MGKNGKSVRHPHVSQCKVSNLKYTVWQAERRYLISLTYKYRPKKSVDDLRVVIAESLQDLKQLAKEEPEETQAFLEVVNMALQSPAELEMQQENEKLRLENAELRRKYITLLETQTAQMKEIREDLTERLPQIESIQEEEAHHELVRDRTLRS